MEFNDILILIIITYFSFSEAFSIKNLIATKRFPNVVVDAYSAIPSASAM